MARECESSGDRRRGQRQRRATTTERIISVSILGDGQEALLRPGHCGCFAWPAGDTAMPWPLLDLLRPSAPSVGGHSRRPAATANHAD